MAFLRPEIVRPPSEWASYFLPLTSGCSNHRCTFCRNYGDTLRIRGIDDIKKEIDAVSLFIRRGLTITGMPEIVYEIAQGWDRSGVFLLDSDALVYPFQGLKEILQYLNEKLPFIKRVAAYATAQDILRKSPDELAELATLKLGILYIGLESGDDRILQKIGKGSNSQQMVVAAVKARKAGIMTSVTVILGMAGTEGSEEHAIATAKVLSEMDPDYVGALTVTLVPGTPLYQEWQKGEFSPISPFQSLRELKTMIERSTFTNCFFSSMHASNYFSIRGRLPQEKDRMIRDLERVLERADERWLRPEFLRGL
jgi:radical SAM superfamily enzyme YgiQ (UPF0313 family)